MVSGQEAQQKPRSMGGYHIYVYIVQGICHGSFKDHALSMLMYADMYIQTQDADDLDIDLCAFMFAHKSIYL